MTKLGDKTFGRGQAFQVCVTPQDSDLTVVQFAALTYVDVCCLQETPEFSVEANIITENCISGERIVGVGADDGTDFEVTWFYDSECVGQDNLRTIGTAKSSQSYAVRKVMADGVTGVSTPTTLYARVIFSGYSHGGIGIDDVQTETVSGSVLQGPIIVKPAPV